MKKLLLKILCRLIFRFEFDKEIDQEKRFSVFYRMHRDNDIVALMRTLYTRAYKQYFLEPEDNKEGRLIVKGRMIELEFILDSMENAENNLVQMDKIKVRNEALKKIQDQTYGRIKNLVKKPF